MKSSTHTEKINSDALPLVLQTLQHSGFLRIRHVEALVGMKKSTIWKRVAQGLFPRPLKLSSRMTVWRSSEVLAWIEEQTHQS